MAPSPDPASHQLRGVDSNSAASADSPGAELPITILLKPRAIYRLELSGPLSLAASQIIVTETDTGRLLREIPMVANDSDAVAADVFRTLGGARVTLNILGRNNQSADFPPTRFTSATIKAVADIDHPNPATAARTTRALRLDLIDGHQR